MDNTNKKHFRFKKTKQMKEKSEANEKKQENSKLPVQKQQKNAVKGNSANKNVPAGKKTDNVPIVTPAVVATPSKSKNPKAQKLDQIDTLKSLVKSLSNYTYDITFKKPSDDSPQEEVNEKWYEKYSFDMNDTEIRTAKQYKLHDREMISSSKTAIETAINKEIAKAQHNSRNSNNLTSNEKWINEVIQNGTLSDKIAALVLQVSNSPILHLSTMNTLINYLSKKEQRIVTATLEGIKDLLVSNLLPDRHLLSFDNSPLLYPNLTVNDLILFWYEDKLSNMMLTVIKALEPCLKSNVDFFKKACMTVLKDLIVAKPEREALLLTLLINKLGDPSAKITTHCIDLIKQIVFQHPSMRVVIIREIRQFISNPKLNPRIVYTGILALLQVPISSNNAEVSSAIALQLVETYVSLFESTIKQETMKSKLLSSLLVGINRAYPYLTDKQSLMKYVDSLFRLVHDSSFSTSTQALVLISYIALESDGSKRKPKPSKDDKVNEEVSTDLTNRFYRALYSVLTSDQLFTKSRNTVFMNLLYRSLKRDTNDVRCVVFIKRVLMCCLHSQANVTAAYLLLLSEIIKTKPSIKNLLFHDTNSEAFLKLLGESKAPTNSNHNLGSFDPEKREPMYAVSGKFELWELSLLQHHFHPSVVAFRESLTTEPHMIKYPSDPTLDMTTIAFLNKFAYKNPKQRQGEEKYHRRTAALDAVPVNAPEFLESQTVDPAKKFFFRYFHEREKLQEEGKLRAQTKKHNDDDLEPSDDDSDDGYDSDNKTMKTKKRGRDAEDEIDDYADMLAEGMMKNADDEADIDDDDMEMEGYEEGGDDDSSLGGEDFDDFEEEGSEFENMDEDDDDDDGNYQLEEYVDSEEEEAPVVSKKANQNKNDKSKDKKKNNKKSSKDSFSDFADAADYEEEMEDILNQIKAAQQDLGDAEDKPKKKKQRNKK